MNSMGFDIARSFVTIITNIKKKAFTPRKNIWSDETASMLVTGVEDSLSC